MILAVSQAFRAYQLLEIKKVKQLIGMDIKKLARSFTNIIIIITGTNLFNKLTI
jgi:hypothetical protein